MKIINPPAAASGGGAVAGKWMFTPPVMGGVAAARSIFIGDTALVGATFTNGDFRAERVVFPFPVTGTFGVIMAAAGTAGSAISAGLFNPDNTGVPGLPGTKFLDLGECDLSAAASGAWVGSSVGAVTIPAGEYWFVFSGKATTVTPSLVSQTVAIQWPTYIAGSSRMQRLAFAGTYASPMASMQGIAWSQTQTALVNPVFLRHA